MGKLGGTNPLLGDKEMEAPNWKKIGQGHRASKWPKRSSDVHLFSKLLLSATSSSSQSSALRAAIFQATLSYRSLPGDPLSFMLSTVSAIALKVKITFTKRYNVDNVLLNNNQIQLLVCTSPYKNKNWCYWEVRKATGFRMQITVWIPNHEVPKKQVRTTGCWWFSSLLCWS